MLMKIITIFNRTKFASRVRRHMCSGHFLNYSRLRLDTHLVLVYSFFKFHSINRFQINLHCPESNLAQTSLSQPIISLRTSRKLYNTDHLFRLNKTNNRRRSSHNYDLMRSHTRLIEFGPEHNFRRPWVTGERFSCAYRRDNYNISEKERIKQIKGPAARSLIRRWHQFQYNIINISSAHTPCGCERSENAHMHTRRSVCVCVYINKNKYHSE